MQNQRRGPPRVAAEPKAPAGRKDIDINRERLIYCLTSLVGHKATAKLRNNIIYEGLFHTCALDGDFSITLKCARQLSSEPKSRSGEVIRTLVIPGKDFLQVSAVDVPPPATLGSDTARGLASSSSQDFPVDRDIADKKSGFGRERELVPWGGGDNEAHLESVGGLEDGGGSAQPWDQFRQNEEMYGVTSTYNMDLYTTKLDPNTIPREKRDEAERIAREIEGNRASADMEGRLEEGIDEEAFSAVQSSSSYNRKGGGPEAASASAGGSASNAMAARNPRSTALAVSPAAPLSEMPAAPSTAVSQVPLTKEHLTQHDSLSGVPSDAFAREHRAKRGMITAHSPMRSPTSPMISEMKRINALNLEPALPKLDDKMRTDWINFKQSQTRDRTKSVQGDGMKQRFMLELEVIRKQEAAKQQAASAADSGGEAQGRNSGKPSALTMVPDAGTSAFGREPNGGAMGSGGDTGRSKGFTFNPAAVAFTPTASSPKQGPQQQPQQQQQQSQQQPQQQQQQHQQPQHTGPQFMAHKPSTVSFSLPDMLDKLFEHAVAESSEATSPEWQSADGASFHDLLGQPSASNPLPPPGAMAGGTGPAPWHPHQAAGQLPPGAPAPGQGAGPQMMQQGAFVVAGGPPGGPPQGQMFQAQMFPAPGPGGMAPPRRPQGGGQGGGGAQPPQQQQQPMVFNQQLIAMQPPQNMAMPGGMGGAQGMVVPMMMPAGPGGYIQGFAPQQGQGQPGQLGPQAGGPQQGQMMPQGQMMAQGPMMQAAYHRQMGAPVPPHQMTGHEG